MSCESMRAFSCFDIPKVKGVAVAAPTCRCEYLTIGRERHAVKYRWTCVSVEKKRVYLSIPVPGIPEAKHPMTTRLLRVCDYPGTERYSIDPIRMSGEGLRVYAGIRTPHAEGADITSLRESFAIGREHHAVKPALRCVDLI